MFGEGVEFAGDVGGCAQQVRFVGVLRDHPQRLALAAAADHHGDLRQRRRHIESVGDPIAVTVEAGCLAGEHAEDDLQRLLEALEPIGERPELIPERIMFQLIPSRTDAELGPTTRHHVEGRDRLREQRRVAVGVAGDERRQTDLRGVLGECREQGVALDHRVVGLTEHRQLIEVVHHEDGVETGVLGFLRLRDHGGEQLVCGDAGVGEVRDLVTESSHPFRVVRWTPPARCRRFRVRDCVRTRRSSRSIRRTRRRRRWRSRCGR